MLRNGKYSVIRWKMRILYYATTLILFTSPCKAHKLHFAFNQFEKKTSLEIDASKSPFENGFDKNQERQEIAKAKQNAGIVHGFSEVINGMYLTKRRQSRFLQALY